MECLNDVITTKVQQRIIDNNYFKQYEECCTAIFKKNCSYRVVVSNTVLKYG